MPKKIAISLLLGGLLSAVTLYFAFRKVPFGDLISYLETIDYLWLAPAVALVMVAFVLRVFRWQLILNSALALDFWPAFHPLMISFMINCVMPGRIGELARPLLLKKEHGVAFGTGVATVALERVLDMLFLLGLFTAVFPIVAVRHTFDARLQTAAWGIVRISIVLVVGLALLAFSGTRRPLLRFIEGAAHRAGRSGARIGVHLERSCYLLGRWIESFAEGLKLIADPSRAVACLLLTVLIWAASVMSLYVFAIGCPGINLTMVEAVVVLTITCFFIALPSVPGYWGVWEAGGIFALALFGKPPKDAAGFTLANHAVQIFPVILIGWLSALRTSVTIGQIVQAGMKMEEPVARDLAGDGSQGLR